MKRFLVILAIFILGCAQQETKKQSDDILGIESIIITPTPPIITGNDFTMNFYVKNLRDDMAGKRIKIDEIKCYDWGRCEPKGKDCRTANAKQTDIITGSVEIVEWQFSSPSKEATGNLRVECPIRFKVVYEYEAAKNSEIAIISEQALKEAQKAGENPQPSVTESEAAGPLEIDIEYSLRQPIITNQNVTATLRVVDKGKGIYQSIPNGSLSITPGKELLNFACEKFKKSGDKLVNEASIQMISKKSAPVKCTFTTPGEKAVSEVKTSYMEARLKYSYEVHERRDVTVEPPKE